MNAAVRAQELLEVAGAKRDPVPAQREAAEAKPRLRRPPNLVVESLPVLTEVIYEPMYVRRPQ